MARLLSYTTYLIAGAVILEGRTKEPIPRGVALDSPSWSGKVTVVALWTLRTSPADSVPPVLPPRPPPSTPGMALRFRSSIQDPAPVRSSRKSTVANQGEKSQAQAEPEPRQAKHSKAVVLCIVDDPAPWGFIHHCLSLSGAWGQETLPTGAPVILCLFQQPCRA